MKRQVRRNVFETNSSSMHSIVVKKDGDYYTSEEILRGFWLHSNTETNEKKCVWIIYSEDDLYFGRSPFRALGTFKDKWLYACAALVKEYKDETYKELEAIALKYVPGLKRIELPMENWSIPNIESELNKDSVYVREYGTTEEKFLEYLTNKEKAWGIEEIEYWENNGYFHFERPYTGMVDEDILSGFLEKENISLEEFLTNRKYVIIQDGDEYCYYSDMKKSGLINTDAIKYEYPSKMNYESEEE